MGDRPTTTIVVFCLPATLRRRRRRRGREKDKGGWPRRKKRRRRRRFGEGGPSSPIGTTTAPPSSSSSFSFSGGSRRHEGDLSRRAGRTPLPLFGWYSVSQMGRVVVWLRLLLPTCVSGGGGEGRKGWGCIFFVWYLLPTTTTNLTTQ